jgi:hypothetical protein
LFAANWLDGRWRAHGRGRRAVAGSVIRDDLASVEQVLAGAVEVAERDGGAGLAARGGPGLYIRGRVAEALDEHPEYVVRDGGRDALNPTN